MSQADLTIVLVQRCGPEAINTCLKAILDESTSEPCEVVLVTRCTPTFSTPSIFSQHLKIHHVANSGKILPAHLNAATASANSQYLIFLEDHVLPTPGWLHKLVDFANTNPHFSAVGIHTLADDWTERSVGAGFASQTRLERIILDLESRGMCELNRSSLPVIGDGGLLVRRQDFLDLGGFEERFGSRAATLDFCLRLIGRAKRIAMHPGCVFFQKAPHPDDMDRTDDIRALREHWGVTSGSSVDALWADGLSRGSFVPRFTHRNGHYPKEPCKLPPPYVEVGNGTYFGDDVRFLTWTAEEQIHIGSFCSFASKISIFTGGGHSTATVSTYPFEGMIGCNDPTRSYRTTRDTRIGNDVWVGDGAVIMGGVHIGHGAIIAAYSVVGRDVPPYAVMAGNPAEILRYRFSKPTVEALLRIAWWDWSADTIRSRLEWFFKPVNEFIRQFES